MPNRTEKSAAVCRRGHLQTNDISHDGYGKRCPSCGTEVIVKCDGCQERISTTWVGGHGHDKHKVADFCDNCGAAHPWVGRQGRIYELQNRLDAEDLDPADQLVVREQLEALLNADLDDDEQEKRWARVKRLAPKLWESSQPILDALITSAIRSSL
jgi:hypothetical protein